MNGGHGDLKVSGSEEHLLTAAAEAVNSGYSIRTKKASLVECGGGGMEEDECYEGVWL